jgi:hypothetical protein
LDSDHEEDHRLRVLKYLYVRETGSKRRLKKTVYGGASELIFFPKYYYGEQTEECAIVITHWGGKNLKEPENLSRKRDHLGDVSGKCGDNNKTVS